MIRHFLLFISIFCLSCGQSTAVKTKSRVAYAMVIHGGAGTIKKENMSEEMEKAYTEKLNEALSVGENILKNGGTSMDAVVETIKLMEASPLFNAGIGAVYTSEETNELDASIMNGADTDGGAVAGVKTIKSPITAARAVYEKSKHVLLTGAGAEAFAKSNGCEIVENSYFGTERRLKSLHKAQSKDSQGNLIHPNPDYKYGTVGCVALDKDGNIVAGTSTGEFFIRYAVAHDIAARMEYKNISLEKAAQEVVQGKLVEKGGSGGIVALDKEGNISMEFNTAGMYRGYIRPDERVVKIYQD